MDHYKGVFSILDELGMPDLKPVFVDNFIQDRTLQYMGTEEEFKNLLRELDIPLGKCIPIMKLWFKLSTRKDAPDVTQGADLLNMKHQGISPDMSHAEVQAVVECNDAETQTLPNEPMNPQNTPSSPHNTMSSGYGHLESFNPYHLLGPYGIGLGQPMTAPLTTADMNRRYPHYQPQVFTTPPMWAPSSLNPTPGGEEFGTSGWLATVPQMQQGGPIITSLSRETSPCPSPPLPSEPVDYIADGSVAVKEGLQAIGRSKPSDILDEREDLAIEHFLAREEEKQQSYASALKETQLAAKANESVGKDNQPSYQHHNSHAAAPSSPCPKSSPVPPASPLGTNYAKPQSFNNTSVSNHVNNTKPPGVGNPPSVLPNHVKAQAVRPKEPSSTYGKLDEISIESGTTNKIGSTLKSKGSANLIMYLEQVPVSLEYQKRDNKKGWQLIDGKHLLTARKTQFKPMYCDEKGRMRHGVSVRGADKSEECSKHTVGKAPAYCTFAHSRIGDTLQFICVKCTVEKPRYAYCTEKKKHADFVFNLGPYKNIDGQTWKLIVPENR
ncbi:uncharacterized protein LOC116619363 isoform X2 [Nematostella vectensis]|uniref:uncharacterized protein LOC116619363 isoform X2 n=1 Tax=Nematostella vectensis TaxID=45351 RepID=UPI002077173C|nr:uncharacterized protein LOC116619363 isoform X2 [Nematostella vectensis]